MRDREETLEGTISSNLSLPHIVFQNLVNENLFTFNAAEILLRCSEEAPESLLIAAYCALKISTAKLMQLRDSILLRKNTYNIPMVIFIIFINNTFKIN